MVCPVTYCITNKSNSVTIDDSLCIGCGRCYKACPHSAITFIDDTEEFLSAVNNGEKNIIIVSPAIITAFKDNYKRFIKWLKDYFIATAVFTEAVGAEIYSILSLEILKKNKNRPLIYQHCPSIVEYIKIFYPNLIEHFMPLNSPTLITAKLVREIFNYEGNIAYIGPCLSKKIEFIDTDTSNLVQFNITFESLEKYIKEHNINIEIYEKTDFDIFPAESAYTFCSNRGFAPLIERFSKSFKIRNIEGNEIYFNYLKELSEAITVNSQQLPDFIDILNCEHGCFRGPVSLNSLSLDEEIEMIEKEKEEAIKNFKNKQKRVDKFFNSLIKGKEKISFERAYLSGAAKPVETIANSNLKDIYTQLNKFEPKDFLNCRSCGYKSCQEFATSLFYKRNEKTNCRYYIEKKYITLTSESKTSYRQLDSSSNSIKQNLTNISRTVTKILNYLVSFEEKLKAIDKANKNLTVNADKFEPIILAISDVSEQINLLSLNASIEASRTGELGKGFSVVSSEIRKLADKTKFETSKISPILQSIINDMKDINNHLISLIDESSEFSETVISLNEAIKTVSSDTEKLFSLLQTINIEF